MFLNCLFLCLFVSEHSDNSWMRMMRWPKSCQAVAIEFFCVFVFCICVFLICFLCLYVCEHCDNCQMKLMRWPQSCPAVAIEAFLSRQKQSRGITSTRNTSQLITHCTSGSRFRETYRTTFSLPREMKSPFARLQNIHNNRTCTIRFLFLIMH